MASETEPDEEQKAFAERVACAYGSTDTLLILRWIAARDARIRAAALADSAPTAMQVNIAADRVEYWKGRAQQAEERLRAQHAALADVREVVEPLRTLESKATPGPWRFEAYDYRDGCDMRSRRIVLASLAEGLDSNWPLSTEHGQRADANCKLIAELRNAVSALLKLLDGAAVEGVESGDE